MREFLGQHGTQRVEQTMKICNFCEQDEDNVEILIAGKSANICNQCVHLSHECLIQNVDAKTKLGILRHCIDSVMMNFDDAKQTEQPS